MSPCTVIYGVHGTFRVEKMGLLICAGLKAFVPASQVSDSVNFWRAKPVSAFHSKCMMLPLLDRWQGRSDAW